MNFRKFQTIGFLLDGVKRLAGMLQSHLYFYSYWFQVSSFWFVDGT